MSPTATRLAAGLALTAALVLAGSAIYLRLVPADPRCGTSAIGGGTGALTAAFTLIDETGREVTEADMLDRPALIYFGYTFCPDICSIDVNRNAVAIDILAEAGHEVRPLFITIDPERDTPEVLTEFTDHHHEDMVGLTGSVEAADAAARNFRVYYKSQKAEGEEYYLVDHSSFTYLTLPGKGVVEFFRRDTTPDQIAEITACFVENS